MLKLYTNVVTGKTYDENGDLFEDGLPAIFYKSTATVRWQLCSETPDFAEGSDQTPETFWTKCTDYAQYQAVGAFLTADSDYIKRLPGSLATGISAGTVTSISATIEGADFDTIPPTGVVELFASDGSSEIVKYASRTIEDGTVTFTAVSGSSVEKAYASGSAMDASQECLMQTSLDTQASDVANGLFAFRITAFSRKLHDLVAYSDVKSVDVMGLELALFRIDSDTNAVVDLERFEVDTFQIRTGMAETSANPPVTDPEANEIVTLCNTLLAAGFSLQFSADGSNWHDMQVTTGETIDVFFRFRSAGSGGTWSNGVRLVKGDKGDAGASAFVYIRYASDTSGTGFSATPSDSLTYIGVLATTTAIETPQASDFTGKWSLYKGPQGNPGAAGQRGTVTYFGTAITGTNTTPSVYDTDIEDSLIGDVYVNSSTMNLYVCTLGGDDTVATWAYVGSLKGPTGESRYVYQGYASNSSGANFSTTPSTSLPYTAFIITATALNPPTSSDFSGATWLKYLGSDGASTYTYVAYASNSSGANFSNTPSDSLKYRAEIHVSSPITTPTSSDFSGATWVKYLGDNGTNGSNGTRGSRFNYGTAITGTSETPTAYATGISDSLINDAYVNTDTQNLYRCTLGGDASTAKWVYVGSMKGSDANAPIDTVQLNGQDLPIASKKVNVMALPMAEDSMPSAATCQQKHVLYLGTTVSADSYVGKLRTWQSKGEDVQGVHNYCDLAISDASATGQSRVWQGYNDIEQQYRIRYNNGWVLDRIPSDPEDPAVQIGTLTTPSSAGQPWGAYTITATSATWYFMPVTDAPQATKGHIYEKNDAYDSSVIFVTINNSTSTLIKVSGTNKWSDDGTDDGDVFVAWNGANGCWEYYSSSAYMSPACQSTVMPWDPSISGQVWTESGDEGTITPIITRCFVGGWTDLGSILGA